MRIETPGGGYVEVERDDLNVFESSPSAIVLTLATDWPEVHLDHGATLIHCEGKVHSETQLSFPMQAARKLHEELGRLIDATPSRASNSQEGK